jgi:hypothetical protein
LYRYFGFAGHIFFQYVTLTIFGAKWWICEDHKNGHETGWECRNGDANPFAKDQWRNLASCLVNIAPAKCQRCRVNVNAERVSEIVKS